MGTRIWQSATVVAVEKGRVRLRLARRAPCSQCRDGGGCGMGSLLVWWPQAEWLIEDGSEWRPGQRVRVGVTADWLLRAALRAYATPLFGFLAGACIGHYLSPVPAAADGLALLAGLGLGALAGHWAGRLSPVDGNPCLQSVSCPISAEAA